VLLIEEVEVEVDNFGFGREAEVDALSFGKDVESVDKFNLDNVILHFSIERR
jgi:hypothetical protein